MKNLRMLNILIWAAVALALTGVLISAWHNSLYDFGGIFGTMEKNTIKREAVDIEGIEKITGDFKSANISIIRSPKDSFRIHLRASLKTKEKHTFEISKENGEIRIIDRAPSIAKTIFGVGSWTREFEIYVPDNYSGDLSVYNTSGDYQVSAPLNVNNLYLESTSGNISFLEKVKANQIELHTTSGNITGAKLYADKVTAKLSSGEFSASSLVSDNFRIDTSSGDIEIKSLEGKGELSASSGSISAYIALLTGELDAEASSGNIYFDVAPQLDFDFEGFSSSGSISVNAQNISQKAENSLKVSVGSKPEHTVTAKSSSGKIKIKG